MLTIILKQKQTPDNKGLSFIMSPSAPSAMAPRITVIEIKTLAEGKERGGEERKTSEKWRIEVTRLKEELCDECQPAACLILRDGRGM